MAFYENILPFLAVVSAALVNAQLPQYQMQSPDSAQFMHMRAPNGPFARAALPANDNPGTGFGGGDAAVDWRAYQMARHHNLMNSWNSGNLDRSAVAGWRPWWQMRPALVPTHEAMTQPMDDKQVDDVKESSESSDEEADNVPQQRMTSSWAVPAISNDNTGPEEAGVPPFVMMMMKRRRAIQAAMRAAADDKDEKEEADDDDDDDNNRRPPWKKDDDDEDSDDNNDDDSDRRGGLGCGCGGRGRHGGRRHHKHRRHGRHHHRRPRHHDDSDDDDDQRRPWFKSADSDDSMRPYRPWADNDMLRRHQAPFGDFQRRRAAWWWRRFEQNRQANMMGRGFGDGEGGMGGGLGGSQEQTRPQIGPIFVIMQQPTQTPADEPVQDQDQQQQQTDQPTDQPTDTTTDSPLPSPPPPPPAALHEHRAPKFPQPWEVCNITCSQDPMRAVMQRPSFGAGRGLNEPPTPCMKCQQECHQRQPVNVTQLFACVKQTVNDMMPAGSCRNAFTCLTSCIPTPSVRRMPSPTDPAEFQQPENFTVAPVSWNDCISKCCDDANGCVNRYTGNNLMCTLQERVRDKVLNTCDMCQSQCSDVCAQEQQGGAAVPPPPPPPPPSDSPAFSPVSQPPPPPPPTDGADSNTN